MSCISIQIPSSCTKARLYATLLCAWMDHTDLTFDTWLWCLRRTEVRNSSRRQFNMFQWGAPWGWGSLIDPNFLYLLFMLLCESQKIIDISTITATAVQYLNQFTNILLITLYFYPQFFVARYHRSQIGASNFTCIYCADVVLYWKVPHQENQEMTYPRLANLTP